MPEWVNPAIVAVVSGLMVLVGNLVVQKFRSKRADPPTWPEMWARLKAVEDRLEVSDRRWSSIVVTLLDEFPKTKVIELHPDDYAFAKETLPAYQVARLKPRQA